MCSHSIVITKMENTKKKQENGLFWKREELNEELTKLNLIKQLITLRETKRSVDKIENALEFADLLFLKNYNLSDLNSEIVNLLNNLLIKRREYDEVEQKG